MYITLIIFFLIGILGYLLHRKNIISQTSKFLLLVSYKNVDPIGPTFKAIIEGFLNLIVTFLYQGLWFPASNSVFLRMEIEKEFNFYFFIKKIKIFGREVSGCSSFQSFGG